MTERRSLFRILTCIGFLVGASCIVAPRVSSATSILEYDSLNRLTQVEYADGTVIAYTYDAAGNRLTEDVDTAAPSITIDLPTGAGIYATSTSMLDISGTAADDTAVAEVTWSNDRGGSGTAVGTMSWMVLGIQLQPGVNVLTVTATDTVGKTAIGTLTVTLAVSTPTDTPTQGPTSIPIGSNTPAVSATPTQTAMSTPTSIAGTSTATATSANTPTKPATSTATPMLTPTETPTVTPSVAPTHTPTATNSYTVNPTRTPTPTRPPTLTPLPTPSVVLTDVVGALFDEIDATGADVNGDGAVTAADLPALIALSP